MNEKTKLIDPDFEEPSLWSEWLMALMNPSILVHAGYELVNSFLATRPWRRILLFSPVLLILFAAIGLIIWGKTIGRQTLVMRYAVWAEAELARLKSEATTDEPAGPRLLNDERSSPLSDMLYRRLLQLNDENARTRYLVAMQMAKSQRVGQARSLMEEIAPLGENRKGYEPAHAWLAVDLLSRQPLNNEDQVRLQSHLNAIQNWDGASSGLLAVHSNILAAQGKRSESLDLMGRAAKKDPSLQSSHAILARKLNMPRVADEVSSKARERLKELTARPDAKLQDFIQLSTLELTENKFEDALRVTREGLSKLGNDNEQLKFIGSEALRLMYRKSLQKTAKGVEFNLNLLDAAMREYPANPNLATEVALLENMGVEASAELKDLMEQQLANGQATAVAHLILANQQIKNGHMAEAIPHLELTVKAAPNHPIALNNLALALALTDSANVARAEELIDRALKIDSRNPELFDSQGQIRLIAGRPLDAVESCEKSISMDPNRIGTRELIVKAYRQAKLEDMAVKQEVTLEKLKAEIQKRQLENSEQKAVSPTSPADSSTPAPAEPPAAEKNLQTKRR